MKKLTKPQAETLDLLRNGWQLGKYIRSSGVFSYRMQYGGIGKGGEARQVSATVFMALNEAKLLTCSYSDYRLEKYDAVPATTP